MSVVGRHSLPSRCRPMSALPPIATFQCMVRNNAKCTIAAICSAAIVGLFDPLVGAARGRHSSVERLERVHPLVRTHKQLDRVLSEIEANLF